MSLKDDLDKYFLTVAKQIRDKIELGISIAVTNEIKSLFSLKKNLDLEHTASLYIASGRCLTNLLHRCHGLSLLGSTLL